MFVENLVVDYRDRPEGSQSKRNTFSDGIKVLLTILKLFRTYKPLKFFGFLSLILAIVGGTFLVPVILEYFQTGLVERFPTLIVCCFALLTSIISLFSGVILDTITWKNRQDFEMELQRAKHWAEEKEKERSNVLD